MSTRIPTLMADAMPLAVAKRAAPPHSQSLETKREPQTVLDVLEAEVAEAPQRISDVSIAREFGEGERVSKRLNYRRLPL